MPVTPAQPTRRRRAADDAEPVADRRQAIVDAATAALGREGFQSTSIKDIAAEAGVAPGLVHYYFASKEELLVAVLDGLCQEISRRWRAAIEGLRDPIDKVDAALRASAEWVRAHPEFYRIVFDLHAVGFTNDAVRRGLDELWARQIRDIEREVEVIYRETHVPDALPPRRAAELIAAAVDGLALHWLAHGIDVEEGHRTLTLVLASTLAVSALAAGTEVPLERLAAIAGASAGGAKA